MEWASSIIRIYNGLPNASGAFVGTGFFLDAQTIITAKHVVEKSTNGVYIEGAPGGGKEKIESKMIFSCERDIAILKTNRAFDGIKKIPFSSF